MMETNNKNGIIESSIMIGTLFIFSGLYMWIKNMNDSYIQGSISPSNVTNTNDATKAGMPYSLDLTKIINIPNGMSSNGGGIVYNYGQWSNNLLKKNGDGYYLYGGSTNDGSYKPYIYDLNTGAYLGTVVAYTSASLEEAQSSAKAAQIAGATASQKAGMPYSIDMTKFSPYTSNSYMNYTYLGNNMDAFYMLFKGINDNLIYCYSMNDGSWVRTYDPNDVTVDPNYM